MKKVDFTDCPINQFRLYGGANGNKICVTYQNENYMLKFPPISKDNIEMSYTNSCISEHIACSIFSSLGIETQTTLLGTYKNKVVVACKDFEIDGFKFKDFGHLKNTIIDSANNGYGTELVDVLETIQKQQLISPNELEEYFWNMFVADAFLGNFDRHNGNWGFLINETKGVVKISPIYDCGSCLYPQLDDNKMASVLENPDEINRRIFEFPNSAIKQNGKKINYYQFLTTTENKGCISAIKNIASKIDLSKINAIIENTPYISDLQKTFFKTILKERKEQIIDKSIECINAKEVASQKSKEHQSQIPPALKKALEQNPNLGTPLDLINDKGIGIGD